MNDGLQRLLSRSDEELIAALLWCHMLESTMLIRAHAHVKGELGPEWAAVIAYLENMLEQGPFCEALRGFADTCLTSATEITSGKVNWKRALEVARRMGAPDA